MTGLKKLHTTFIYLWNSLILGRFKINVFGRLKEKVQAWLESWKSKLLSRAGKATLIIYVIQAIPNYTMTTFVIPKKVCKGLDTLAMPF